MGLGVGMVVSMFLLKWAFLVKRMLDCCSCMWPLTVTSEFGAYLVNWFAVNLGQDKRKYFSFALHQVKIVGKKKAPW